MDKQEPTYPESNDQPPISPPVSQNNDPQLSNDAGSYNEYEEPTVGSNPDIEPSPTEVDQANDIPADSQTETPAAAVAVEPQAAASASAPVVSAVPKKSKKPLIIGGIVALLLVLIGASVAGYSMWYQNPDKVLVDSVVNAVKAKSITGNGTMTYTSKDGNFDLIVDNRANHQEGHAGVKATIEIKDPAIKLKLNGEGMYVKDGSMFVKLNDADKIYEQVVDEYIDLMAAEYNGTITDDMKAEARADMDDQFKPIVDKINNRWIKLDSDSLKDVDEEAGKTQECLTDAFAKIKDNQAMSDEIGTLYKNNKFVIVKEELGDKDGNLGYLVDFDQASAKSFGEGLKNTAFGKEINKCDESILEDSEDAVSGKDDSDTKDQRFEVWVSRWSHELAKVSFSAASTQDDEGKIKLEYSPIFNSDISVDVPKDFITVDEITEEFNSSMSESAEI